MVLSALKRHDVFGYGHQNFEECFYNSLKVNCEARDSSWVSLLYFSINKLSDEYKLSNKQHDYLISQIEDKILLLLNGVLNDKSNLG